MENQIATVKRIDELSKSAAVAFAEPASFEQELAVARSIQDLRAALTAEIMGDVMALQNTSLGFRTDRDPKVTPKDKEGNPMTPYGVDVVRDCFIEARLRGFHAINNEFNIIAGRFYAALNGLERRVRKHPKVTDLRDSYSVPVSHGEKGAIVKARADWIQDGVKQSLERDFPVRVNLGMGADAIVGKAKRKLFAAVFSRLSGVVTPEGEAGDEAISVTATQETPTTPEKLFGGQQQSGAKATSAVPTGTAANHGPAATENAPASPQNPDWKVSRKKATPARQSLDETPQQRIERFICSECGVAFDDLRDYLAVKGLISADKKDSLTCCAEIPTHAADEFLASAQSQKDVIRLYGKKA